MKTIAKLKAELDKMKKELEFIHGQLCNERILFEDDLSELSYKDIQALTAQNKKLLTRITQLETMLEV